MKFKCPSCNWIREIPDYYVQEFNFKVHQCYCGGMMVEIKEVEIGETKN